MDNSQWGKNAKDNKGPHVDNADNMNQDNNDKGKKDKNPPDVDSILKDINDKLLGLLNFKNKQLNGGNGGKGSNNLGKNFYKNSILTFLGLFLFIWLCTGFFVVQEGQEAAILQFGKYVRSVGAGFSWHWPYPFQTKEIVNFSQLRSVSIGTGEVVKATAIRDSSMLTKDENIIDLKFAVQYRLKNIKDFLFENSDPDLNVVKVAETAVREVVAKNNMDTVLYEGREQIALDLQALMQKILDLYKIGILVTSVTLQNVQPPEQVQMAFDDAVKAGQDKERLINEAQAYANDIIPKAKGTASRLYEESIAYKTKVVSQAQGDVSRFNHVYNEYKKAPKAIKDKMYLETMQQIYSNVNKFLIDTHSGHNLINLPFDKLIQFTQQSNLVSPTSNTANFSTNNLTNTLTNNLGVGQNLLRNNFPNNTLNYQNSNNNLSNNYSSNYGNLRPNSGELKDNVRDAAEESAREAKNIKDEGANVIDRNRDLF